MNRLLVAVLIASLGGNAVLLARRYASPPSATLRPAVEHDGKNRARPADMPGATTHAGPEAGATAVRGAQRSVWDAMAADDPKMLLANLRAAGMAEEDARAVVRARIFRQFEPRRAAIMSGAQDLPYWKTARSAFQDPGRRMELRQLQREQETMLRDVFGEAGTDGFPSTMVIGSVSLADVKSIPLPPEKQQALSRVMRDYADMSSDVLFESGFGILMPWDREKLAYLEEEKRKDIASVLTPEELETYDLYASGTAQNLRRQLSGFEATEAEFRAIYAIEAASRSGLPAEVFGAPVSFSPGSASERREKIKAALGEARYADYERVTDQSFQRARDITTRLNLPMENATAAYQLGREMQQRAEEVRAASAMTNDERKAAMAALAREASAHLDALLTPEGAKAYRNSGGSSWLRSIEARGGVR